MKTMNLAIALFGAALSLTAPMALQAQDASELSAEELEALFESQRTRGLVLAPVAEDAAAADDLAATDDGTTAALPENYSAVAPGTEVFIRVEFAFDSAALADSEKAKLGTLCQVMKDSDIPLFQIIGHTDASGTDDYNQRLSLLRAEEVQRHLISDCGISPDRLEALGVGEAFPFDPADPRSDANRRVEFQVAS